MERIVGVLIALLLCAASGIFFWFSLTVLKSLWALLFAGAFATFSAYLMYLLLFTRKLRITSQRPLHRFISIMIAATIAWAVFYFGLLWPRTQ